MTQPLRLDTKRLGRILPWMQRYVKDRKYAGSSILIYENGHEKYHAATGLRDRECALPFKRDSVVRLYSMTKPVTSVALMTLVEQGLCTLDMPVSDFLPEFTSPTALIKDATRLDQSEPCAVPTLHQLLTHTSGLTYSFNPGLVSQEMGEERLDFGPSDQTAAEICQKLAALPLCFSPGQRWEYSVGIDVIGRVIEVISGRALDRFFQDEIFAPLCMTQTGFQFQEAHKGRIASLYTPLEGNAMDINAQQKSDETLRLIDQEADSPYWNTKTFSGGGGLVGTLDDYMRFAECLRAGGTGERGRILSNSTLEFMMSNHLSGDIASMGPQSFAEQPMHGIGFGIGGAVVLDPARSRTPGHIGDYSWGGMASTFFWVDPSSKLSVVFLTQLSPSSSYPSRAELKALVHGALVR